jgi:hypothetical protein
MSMSTSSDIQLPKELPQDVREWDDDHVEVFLKSNQPSFKLKDQHIQILKEQEFSGRGLLEVTVEELTRCGLKMGPAKNIKSMVDVLKVVKGPGELVKPSCGGSLARLSSLVWFELQLS